MGMGALSLEHGDGSKGTISWEWEHADCSMGMRAWDESMGTKMWGWELLSGILFKQFQIHLIN